LALVPPDPQWTDREEPVGFAAVAGALGDWEELDAVVEEIYRSRRAARDRSVPPLE
jgi:hypothetical protein